MAQFLGRGYLPAPLQGIPTMTELVTDLQNRLDRKAVASKRRWWEQYLKGQAQFRGVAMEDVRQSVTAWVADYALLSLSDRDLFRLMTSLVSKPHSEDKLAATLLLQEHALAAGRLPWGQVLDAASGFFDDGLLADWNVVDWFAVKALWSLVERDGAECGRAILGWSSAANLWHARASVVTFANVSQRGDVVLPGFTDGVLAASGELIRRPERFAKTGVGWVLRGLREAEASRVDAFIDEHLTSFSLEALKSTLRATSPGHQRVVLARWKTAIG